MTESAFFQDLAILMMVAGLMAVLFSRLGWPKVLGYLGAGILMSEHTWGGSFLADPNSITTIGQLGIVFLMFAMGLSFSMRDLKRMKGVTLPCAAVDVIVMIWLGYTLGVRVFGWTPLQSVFLGVAMCDSATTLLAKVIGEMGWSSRPFAKYVLGTSVCEDIVCVGAIAVATGFATGEGLSLSALSLSLGKLLLFFLAVIVFGLIFVPRLLRSVCRRNDDEAFLLTILGSCFVVSYFAYQFDLSLALGAFLVGLLGASSDVRSRIAALVEPLKSMFSAVFFVSIGLLVDPVMCLDYAPEILAVSAVVIVGKLINNTIVSLLAGVDVKTAIQNGFSLAQIGEFAFMVAILYAGIVNDSTNPLFQIAVGASLLTTLLNPWFIRVSDGVGDFVDGRLPARMKRYIVEYQGWLTKIGTSRGSPAFQTFKSCLIRLGIVAGLIFSVSLVCSLLHRFDYSRFSVFLERHDQLLFYLLANVFALVMLPMCVALARQLGRALGDLLLGAEGPKWLQPVRGLVSFVALMAVLALFFAELSMVNLSLAPKDELTSWIVAGALLLLGVFGWRQFKRAGRRAIARLNESLSAEDRQEKLGRMMSVQIPEGTVHRLALEADSPAIGGTVVTLNIRAKTGCSVLAVVRDEQTYRNVGPDFEFAIGDTLVVLGTGAQVAALKDLLGVMK